jgi:uncharacterized protein (DUF983 family)
MTKLQTFGEDESHGGQAGGRPLVAAMQRGARGACPHCGEGRLFSRWLAVEPRCESCGEELFHQRADDLPAYLNIFITGHVVVALILLIIDAEFLPEWGMILLASGVALAFAVAMMRPLKGMVIGAQWALAMHGFGGHDD